MDLFSRVWSSVAESFFSSLKKERIKKQIYKNRELAIGEVGDYIGTFYNRTRRHSHLGGLSCEQFEAAHRSSRQGLHWILGIPPDGARFHWMLALMMIAPKGRSSRRSNNNSGCA
jgi:hypothetical protein